MGFGVLIAILSGLAHAEEPCEDPRILVNQAQGDVEGFFLAEAESEINRTKRAFGCSGLPNSDLLARMWQAEGVIQTMQGNADVASLSFAAAERMAPGSWNENYGEEMKGVFALAAAKVESKPAQLRFKSLPKGSQVAIDGVVQEAPFNLDGGLHLVQVGPPNEVAEWARVIEVPAGEQMVILVDTQTVIEGNQPILPIVVKSYKGHPSRNIALIGLASGLVAGAGFATAAVSHNNFMDESDKDAATPHLTTNRVANITGIVLGTAAGGLVLGAVVQGKW